MPELTKAEQLLLAAARLAAARTPTEPREFSAEDLVVEVFKEYPASFCLKGHPEYPNSNTVYTFLMGKNARLIVTGWLEKSGTNMYRITPKGLSYADSVSEHTIVPSVAVERQLEDGLARLLDSAAFKLFREGRKDEITFHQFCRFMGLAAPDKWQKVQGKIRTVEHLVAQAVERGESGNELRLHYKKRNEIYTPEDLRTLRAALGYMRGKFDSQMKEWERNATS
jgi:DNA-binding PadR family transcriptional regulator